MIEIDIPVDLMGKNTINFCKSLDNIPFDSEYKFTFSLGASRGTYEPFGMLLTGAKIRQFMKDAKEKGAKFKYKYYDLNDYVGHMGFYRSIGLPAGKAPGEALGSSTYIPITSINTAEVREESKTKSKEVGEIIEKRSRKLAKILSRENENLEEYLTYSIRELIRNVVEHSRSEKIWIAGQYWPYKGNVVEIAILDEGVGVKQTLSEHPGIRVKGDEDALLLSLEPGITGNQFAWAMEEDIWRNSGYGLYMTSSICQKGGNFIICSGSKGLIIDEDGCKTVDTSYKGTAIRMRIEVSKIGELQEVLSELADEGMKRAEKNSGHSIKSASLVSRMLVTD